MAARRVKKPRSNAQIAAAKKNLEKARAARSKKTAAVIKKAPSQGTRLVGGGSKGRAVDPWATRLSDSDLHTRAKETAANIKKYKNTPNMPIGQMKMNLSDLRTEIRRRKRNSSQGKKLKN